MSKKPGPITFKCGCCSKEYVVDVWEVEPSSDLDKLKAVLGRDRGKL